MQPWSRRFLVLLGSLSLLVLLAGWLWSPHRATPRSDETDASPAYVSFLSGMLVERTLLDCYQHDWLIFSYDTQENIRLNMRLRARAFHLASPQYTCEDLRRLEAAIRPQASFPATGRPGHVVIPVQGLHIAIDAERMAWPATLVQIQPSPEPLFIENPLGPGIMGQALTFAIQDGYGRAVHFGTAYQGTPAYPLPAMVGPTPACWHFLWHAQMWKLMQITTDKEQPCKGQVAHEEQTR